MTRWGRIALVLTLPLAVAATVSSPAWARAISVAKGSITCTVVAGHATFSPPLTRTGTSNQEMIRFRLAVSGCTPADGSKLTAVLSRSFRITMPVPTTTDDTANACTTAMPADGTMPAASLGRWKSQGLVVHPTKLTTTGESWNTTGAHVSVALPGNGSAENAGTSFSGYDGGTNSTISLALALTGAQYAAVCDPTTGSGHLARSLVTGGTISLGPTLFSGFTGSSGWVSGADPLVPSDSDGVALDLDSPNTCSATNGYTDCSYAGMTLWGVDGLSLSKITALSYDFAVQTPGWSAEGGGSPRLVLELSDGGQVQLDTSATVTTGTWVHLDAISGAVDNVNGTAENCGTYQISWSTAVSCHGTATILDAFIVNDSGWEASSGLDLWVDNMTLNRTVISAPLG